MSHGVESPAPGETVTYYDRRFARAAWSPAVKRFLLETRSWKSGPMGCWARLLDLCPVPRFVSVPVRPGGDFSEPAIVCPGHKQLTLTCLGCYLPTDSRALGIMGV
jgi:hypothetical protein